VTLQFVPVHADAIAELVADQLHSAAPPGITLRVAIDGPRCAQPGALASRVVGPLRLLGHETAIIEADTFWRDASLRLEFGREDVDSYRDWTDRAALRREVLEPLGPGGAGAYLPSLRDPVNNRSTRQPARQAQPGSVVIITGDFLLGGELPFDVSIHLLMSPAARARRTSVELQWTLPAYDAYDADVGPAGLADLVIKLDDPRHPAVARRARP
jgi:hypothetical protein